MNVSMANQVQQLPVIQWEPPKPQVKAVPLVWDNPPAPKTNNINLFPYFGIVAVFLASMCAIGLTSEIVSQQQADSSYEYVRQ